MTNLDVEHIEQQAVPPDFQRRVLTFLSDEHLLGSETEVHNGPPFRAADVQSVELIRSSSVTTTLTQASASCNSNEASSKVHPASLTIRLRSDRKHNAVNEAYLEGHVSSISTRPRKRQSWMARIYMASSRAPHPTGNHRRYQL